MAGKMFNREVICARGLRKKYGDKEVVRGINLSVSKGECFGILGPNGAGKTTIVKMIFGLSPPTSGTLLVLGMNVNGNQREIKKHLGVVSQEDHLDSDLNVGENLEVFARYYGMRPAESRPYVKQLLELMGLSDRYRSKIHELSGGMRRRLSIARSLINNPDLLILDEPTTGLDPHARRLVWQMLRSIKEKQITMLLTTHYLEEASILCDRLVIMDDGIILDEGNPRFLVKKHAGEEVLELGLREKPEFWQNEISARFGDMQKGSLLLGDSLYFYLNGDGKVLLNEINSLATPVSYHLLRPSNLEDVFLKLTGKKLETES
ncbi:MAG: ABC transporter ATP-binding protein [Bacillota bacterium]|nr:ABC transporter ATP-binding protein [Bacillota bacterium]